MGTSRHDSGEATSERSHAFPTTDRNTPKSHILALHCSGSNESQWRKLRDTIGGAYGFFCPEFYGCENTGPWTGEHAFTLMDDARRAIKAIDSVDGPIHLIGHSYGGGVALRVAVERRERIASMALYEPSAFHLLKTMGPAGAVALAEISGVAHRTGIGLVTGDYISGLAAFVDYWNGPGAWHGLCPEVQAGLRAWAPKAPLDFHALIEEMTPAAVYQNLEFPVLMMRGTNVRAPSRAVIDRLREILPDNHLEVIDGAGHMGPFSHANDVNRLIAAHIAMVEDLDRAVAFAPAHDRLDQGRGFAAATDRFAHAGLRAA